MRCIAEKLMNKNVESLVGDQLKDGGALRGMAT